MDEDHPLAPADVNGINKISGEFYHLVYNQVYNIRACSLRLTNTYGPRQLIRHNRQGFIGWFMRKAVLGETIEVFGDGAQRRDFDYVDDVVDAFLRAGASEASNGQVFNLGGGAPISLLDLANDLVRLSGEERDQGRPLPRRAQEDRHRRLLFGRAEDRARSRLEVHDSLRGGSHPDHRLLPKAQGPLLVTETIPVPFNDLKPKVAAHRAAIDRAIARVLDRGWFILGPEVDAFEKELAAAMGAVDAVSVANGTDALILALEVKGIGPGDEVITSPMSAAFSALAISRLGATPVFGDVDPVTMNLDPANDRGADHDANARHPARASVRPSRGSGPDHGHRATAQSRRGRRRLPGPRRAATRAARWAASPASRACPSIPPRIWAVSETAAPSSSTIPLSRRKLRQLRNGGQSEKYKHDILGTNSRLDDMQAAILRELLQTLDAETARRREIAERYFEAFSRPSPRVARGTELRARRLPPLRGAAQAAGQSSWRRSAARGVGTLIHYPVALHLQRAYASLGGKRGDRPVVEQAADEIVSLPVYPELTDAQVGAVIAAVKEAVHA